MYPEIAFRAFPPGLWGLLLCVYSVQGQLQDTKTSGLGYYLVVLWAFSSSVIGQDVGKALMTLTPQEIRDVHYCIQTYINITNRGNSQQSVVICA